MKKIVGYIRRIEKYLLALLVLGISFFSIGQILLRRFLRVPLWMDSCINILVVWTTFIAAGVVTYEASHIKIDIIGRFVKGIQKKFVYGFISLFGAMVSSFFMTLFIVYLTVIKYLSNVAAQGTDALIYTLRLVIIPWGFFVMSIRMINMMCADFQEAAIFISGKNDSSLFKILFSITNAFFLGTSIFMYFTKGDVLCLCLSICALLLTITFGVMSAVKAAQKQVGAISIVSGIIIIALFIIQIIEIIDVNYQVKVTGDLLDVTDTELNKMYILPTLSFFFGWLSVVVPFGGYLRDIYPESVESVGEEVAR